MFCVRASSSLAFWKKHTRSIERLSSRLRKIYFGKPSKFWNMATPSPNNQRLRPSTACANKHPLRRVAGGRKGAALSTTVLPLVLCGALAAKKKKHAAIAVTFLVLPTVTTTIFKIFPCDDLGNEKEYLHADYSLSCKSASHQVRQCLLG